jgi:hypothetical protein
MEMIAVDHRAFPQIAEKWRKTLDDSLFELMKSGLQASRSAGEVPEI